MQYTQQVYGWIARLSGWMPFAAAAKTATALLGVAVSKSSAMRAAETVGGTYVAMQTEQAAVLERCAPLAPVGAVRMVVSADGVMVPLLHREWGEVRTLAVGEEVKRCSPCRRRVVTSTPSAGTGRNQPVQPEIHTANISYFSGFTSAEAFTHLAVVETHQRGLENARQVAAVMDGADWLQQFTDYHCPRAVRILDFSHAAQRVADSRSVRSSAP